MKRNIIILRECEGRLSIMKEATSDRWLTFLDYHTAADYLDEHKENYKISDVFFIVQHIGQVHIDEEVTRVIRRTVSS